MIIWKGCSIENVEYPSNDPQYCLSIETMVCYE